MKYENGKIYKIESDSTEKVYIGSTTQRLSQRMAKHRANYKKYNEGKYYFVTSFDILKFGDAKIFLIENYPCSNKEELEARQRHYIKTTNCVNKRQPGRTDKEYKEDNKEIIKEKTKAYRQANNEILKKKYNAYYQANKTRAHEYKVKRIMCECGREVAQGNMSRHKKSEVHTDAMAKLN